MRRLVGDAMSVTVTLGMVTWNTRKATLLTLAALLNEHARLEAGGYSVNVELIDNASWDGTADLLRAAAKSNRRDVQCEVLEAPVAVSTARNLLVERAVASDYLVFVDGDIEVIPHSIVAMVHYLQDHDRDTAIAMDPCQQTQTREEVSPYCRSIPRESLQREALMYLCGYGVFRTDAFEHISFEESGPLGQCGWGCEDDDLWLQMVEQQMRAVYTNAFRFYHVEPHSSWPSLRALGIDPIQTYEARRNAILAKWRGLNPLHLEGRLNLIAGQHLHA